MKTLPFQINRHAPDPLNEQVVNGLTAAVRNGYLKPGERLPSIDGLAEELAVGTQTVRKALKKLSDQGDLVVRPRQGIVVADRRKTWFTKHVVHLRFGGAGYYFNAKHQRFESVLLEKQVRTTGVRICEEEFRAGLPHLKLILDSQPVDLVFLDGPSGGLLHELHKRQIPFVVAEEDPEPLGALAGVATDRSAAYEQLIAHFSAGGTEHLCVVGNRARHGEAVHAMAIEAGIKCSLLEQPENDRSFFGETPAERHGYQLVQRLLCQTTPLPDTIFFHDDYLARGGYLALVEAGIRIPDNMQLATVVNRGHCPFFAKVPTRIEIDPERDGETTAAIIMQLLKGEKPVPAGATLGAIFVPGKTTRTPESTQTTNGA